MSQQGQGHELNINIGPPVVTTAVGTGIPHLQQQLQTHQILLPGAPGGGPGSEIQAVVHLPVNMPDGSPITIISPQQGITVQQSHPPPPSNPDLPPPTTTHILKAPHQHYQQPHGHGTPESASSHYYSTTNPNYSVESNTLALSDFLVQLEEYAPTIPDSVANHFLHMSGFDSSDPRMSRLISIAAQKFISDIINEAYNHSKLKGATPGGGGGGGNKTKVKDKKFTLTMEDLVPILADYGLTVRKPPYYVGRTKAKYGHYYLIKDST